MGKICSGVIVNILSGNTNPEFLASLCTHWKLKSSQGEIVLSVEGNFTEHHKFILRAIRTNIKNLESQIKDIDEEIRRYMQPIEEEVALLCEIPGIKRTSAIDILAEIGMDREVSPTNAHIASLSGLSPGNNEKNTHTNHGNNETKAVFTECAWPASRTKDTYISSRYKRLAALRGKKSALVATGNELLKIVCHMLKNKAHYKELGPTYLNDKLKSHHIRPTNPQVDFYWNTKPEYETGINCRETKTIASSMRMISHNNSTVSKPYNT